MAWGIGVGIIIIALLFVFFGFIIFKETRTHRFWRQQVEEGDLEMIRQLIEVEVEHWRTERPPKGVPAAVWQGIQGVEIGEIGRDYIRASTSAEPQFAMEGSTRKQVSSALDEAKRITALLAERFFYDIPYVVLDRVQIDCYSTFQEAGSEARQRCILSTLARRGDAAQVDWEGDSLDAIAAQLGGRYQTDASGTPLPIEADEEAVRISPNGGSGNDPVGEAEG